MIKPTALILASWCALVPSVPAHAADAAPAPATVQGPAFRLITLGTQGGPRINSSRAQPANLLTVNGTNYLFDAGNGVARQIALAKVPLATISRIFITHNHDDHNADWGTVMGLEWSLGRYEPMDVYGPRGTENMMLGFLQYFSTNVANRTFKDAKPVPPAEVFRAYDIQKDGLVYQDANIRVTAAENCHFHYVEGQPGYGWQKSYSFRVQAGSKSIVFAGDTGACPEKLTEFVRGADILVHEVALPAIVEQRLKSDPSVRYRPEQIPELMQHMREEHTTPEDIGKLAAAAGVGRVILSHLVPGGDDLPDSAYSDGVKVAYKGPVIVAKDLQVFE